MEAAIINPLLTSVVNVMKTMVHQDVQRGEPVAKKNSLAFGEISSMISMRGLSGMGSIAVSFPLDVIINIANIMLPPDTPKDKETIKDLVGELANMFAGGVKSEMEDAGYDFEILLPQIYAGKPHYLKHVTNQAVVFVPFTGDVGGFFVELCFSKLKKKPKIVKSKLSYAGPSSITRR